MLSVNFCSTMNALRVRPLPQKTSKKKMSLRDALRNMFLDPQIVEMQSVLRQQDATQSPPHLIHPESDCNRAFASLLEDIEMFSSLNACGRPVFFELDRCRLQGSRAYLQHLIQNPLSSSDQLTARREALENLAPYMPVIDRTLDALAPNEQDVLWMFEHKHEDLVQLYNIVYFRSHILGLLNGSPMALSVHNINRILLSPTLGILSPFMYLIIPYLVLRWRFGISLPLTTYVRLVWTAMLTGASTFWKLNGGSRQGSVLPYASMLLMIVFYLQNMFNTLELSKTLHHVSKLLTRRARNITAFLRTAKPLLMGIPQAARACSVWFGDDDKGGSAINVPMFQTEGSVLFSHFGRELSWLKMCDIDLIRSGLRRIHMVDTLASIIRLKIHRSLCDPVYVNTEDSSCVLELSDMWHPILSDVPKLVRNSLKLPPSVLLTGPNAAGKSSCMRAVLVNVLLAQTLTVCYARSARISPFHHMDSQISVPDDKERASLFESECMRCAGTLERIRQHPDERHLVVIDELLSSTNPIDGMSAAFAVAKRIGEHNRNCCALISTHYTYLSRLCLEDERPYQALRMTARIEGDNITYPYRLEAGVSRQSIGIEVMRSKGVFDKDVIQSALDVRTDLSVPEKKKMTK